MRALLQKLKVHFNYGLDRIIDLCDMILVNASSLPGSSSSTAQKIARKVGNLCLLLHDFPRISATEFCGNGWRVIFVGQADNHAEICKTLFDDPVESRSLGRTLLWNLQRQSAEWLESGADLIVQELSPLSPWQSTAPVRFTVPIWIKMVMALPDDLETVLSSNKRKRVRQRVKKGSEAGFQYYFSREKADFDTFHHRMYRPFISLRHGNRAAISTYEHQWKRWFQRGGLVMITQDDQPVGGALCYLGNGTCYSVEGGVLDASPELLKQELNGMIDWYTMHWAHQQGIRRLDMGGTRAHRSDGIFLYKRQWGAKPVLDHRKIFREWVFLGKHIPAGLIDRLNQIGFISTVGNQFFGIHLQPDCLPLDEQALDNLRQSWMAEGIDGVIILPCASRRSMPVGVIDSEIPLRREVIKHKSPKIVLP